VFWKGLPDYLCTMVILIDCRPLQYEANNGEKIQFIISCTAIISRKEGVEWLYLVDNTYKEGMFPGITAESLVVRKTIRGSAGWKFWYAWQIPNLVNKYKPDLVITTGSRAASRIGIPQWIWPWGEIMPGTPVSGYEPLTSEEKESLKQQYAGGREYFLAQVTGNARERRVDLLKAFSLFKKRQKSNMQLIFAGSTPPDDTTFGKRLGTYKYREDVHLYDNLPEREWQKLLGAAYAFIFASAGDSLGIPVLNAWKTGTPVLTDLTGQVPAMAGDAALKAKPDDPTAMAAQMMVLYKDENLRSSLIGKGKDRSASFLWGNAAGQLWARILQTIGDANK
jgi:glycosyl transferase family 1